MTKTDISQCLFNFASLGARVLDQQVKPLPKVHHLPPIPMRVQVPVVPLPICSLLMCLGKQWKIVRVHGLLYTHGRHGKSSWLLTSTWLSPRLCGLLERNRQMEDLRASSLLSFSVTVSFK